MKCLITPQQTHRHIIYIIIITPLKKSRTEVRYNTDNQTMPLVSDTPYGARSSLHEPTLLNTVVRAGPKPQDPQFFVYFCYEVPCR